MLILLIHTKKAEVILQVEESNIDFAPRKNGGKEIERQNREEKEGKRHVLL